MGLYLEGELPRIEPKQDLIQIFVDHCCKSLEIGDDYDIYIVDDRESHGIQTTAYYDPNNKIIKIYAKDRAVPDVLRSIAHELVHAKQDVKGEFDEHPMQHVGGYLEDDANARAGSLIKGFAMNREEDDVYEVKKQFQNLILEDVYYRLEDLEGMPTLAEIKSTIQQSVQEALTAAAKAEIKSKRDVYAKTPAGQTAIYLSVIKVLEQGLSSLGYDVDVDGKFDQKTEDAIKRFQKDNSLTVTGTTTKETWDKFLEKDKEIKTAVTPDIPKDIEKTLIKVKDIDTAAGDLVAGEDTSLGKSGRDLLSDASFNEKLERVSSNLGVEKEALIKVFEIESNVDPQAVNPHSGATGLIQFMPSTAAGLKPAISTSALRSMTGVQQLKYVESYYKKQPSLGSGNFEDMYLATFYPKAIGKPDNYVLGKSKRRQALIANQNPGFHTGKGYVTKGDVLRKIRNKSFKYA